MLNLIMTETFVVSSFYYYLYEIRNFNGEGDEGLYRRLTEDLDINTSHVLHEFEDFFNDTYDELFLAVGIRHSVSVNYHINSELQIRDRIDEVFYDYLRVRGEE